MRRSIGTSGVVASLLLLLTGCDDAKPVGGISAEDAAALNNAAEILDASPDGLAAPEGMEPANDAESSSPAEANGTAGSTAVP